MSPPRVVRITRSDEPDAFVLVYVHSSGSAPLDVMLTATEGECPYTAAVQASKIGSLQAKAYQGSDQEWAHIISSILGQPVTTVEAALLEGIEATASVTGSDEEGKELVITIRKRVQSITQKLGAINLQQNDEQAIELFEWSGIAAAAADSSQSQVIELTNRHHTAENEIKQLKRQLQDLIQAKEQHEKQLMTNFVQLLNEKKLKIRTQQRLLASATVDSDQVSNLRGLAADLTSPQEKPQASKRRMQDILEHEGASEGNCLDRMDLDQPNPADFSDNGTTDDEEPTTPEASQEGRNNPTDNGNEVSNTSAEGKPFDLRKSQEKSSTQMPSAEEAPPPRRQLPFARRAAPTGGNPAKTASSETMEDTGGETDDDEL